MTQTPEQLYGTILIGAGITLAAMWIFSAWMALPGVVLTAIVVATKNEDMRP